jgi:hypothetical protein
MGALLAVFGKELLAASKLWMQISGSCCEASLSVAFAGILLLPTHTHTRQFFAREMGAWS